MRESEDDRQPDAEPTTEEGLARLMADGADDKAVRRRLAERARQEAERAVAEAEVAASAAERALQEGAAAGVDEASEASVRQETPAPASSARSSPPAAPQQVAEEAPAPRALQNALIASLVCVIIVLSLPWQTWFAAPAEQPQEAARSAPQVNSTDAVVEVPYDYELFHSALLLAKQGDFATAAQLLASFLEQHPELPRPIVRGVHNQMALYLRQSGDLLGSLEHERLARAGTMHAYLAEDLLEVARAAEARGDGEAVRRAYARFLLQQDDLSPGLRALISEAWLKLGDSYRMQAGLTDPARSTAEEQR